MPANGRWDLIRRLKANHLQPTKSIYMEPVQGLNLNRRYISRLEPEMPVTDCYSTKRFLAAWILINKTVRECCAVGNASLKFT